MSRQFVEELSTSLVLPVIVAPMFLISGPQLVIAAGKSGLIGCFPASNARTIDDLAEWLPCIDQELRDANRPGQWSINMIVHPSYDRCEQELDLIEEYRPKIVVTALGSPKRVLDRVQRFGGKVFADVISPEHAKKAADAGVDGLILVCTGAGGHTGQFSPLAFIEEVRQFWDGPLVVGGAVQNARSVMAMLTLGADFVYMGTRFISCPESLVSDEYREMLCRANVADILTTAAVTGVKGNWLKESLEKSGFDFTKLDTARKIDFSNVQGDNKAWKNVWGAGQGVGATQSIQNAKEIVDEIVGEFHNLKADQQHLLSTWPRKI